jgi:pimeloyl-ACP methyl ester carboxylesterase
MQPTPKPQPQPQASAEAQARAETQAHAQARQPLSHPHADTGPQTHFVDVPGGQIAYDDSGGNGPLIVCAPGIGDRRQLYGYLRPALAEAGFRVATMDLRGHGESSTGWADYSAAALGADILALIRHLNATHPDATRTGSEPALVIAESITTASAVWAAAQEPDQIAALVLCGPGGQPAGFQRVVMNVGGEIVGRFRWAWMAYWASLFKARKPDDYAEYKKALAAMLAEPGRMAALHGMLRAIAAGTADECNARAPEVRCPALVVMGTKDPDSRDPAAGADAAAKELSGRAVMIEGAGHYAMAEFPDRVAAEIIPFFKQVTGA